MANQRRISRNRRARGQDRGAGSLLRDISSVCLLALFAMQGIVAQGHTHTPARLVVFGDPVVAKTDQSAGGGRGPTAPESSNCGLCQSLGAGTAPLAAAILLLVLPVPEAGPEPRFVGLPVFTVQAVSYFWTPRGPPRSTPLHA